MKNPSLNCVSYLFFRITFFLITALLLFSCSSHSVSRSSGRFKVSVSSDGKAVSDHNQQLIHRVSLDQSKLVEIFNINDDFDSKLASKVVRDLRGSVVGLGFENRSFRKAFKLEQGDVFSSIGKLKVKDNKSLWHIIDLLEKEGRADVTVLRNGLSLKYIYFVNN